MNIPYRPLALGLTALVFATVLYERAQAGGGHFYPPIADPVVKEECGSCHMAFAPSMLPAKSWQVMMGDLANHFGDDASVDAATAARIGAYLQANAADSGGRRYGAKLVSAVAPGSAPQRITKLPKWVAEHRSVPDWEWRHKEVRSPANCVACHADAERGYYES
jgi:hypothetical protein